MKKIAESALWLGVLGAVLYDIHQGVGLVLTAAAFSVTVVVVAVLEGWFKEGGRN
jgi:hypothetical protein